MTTAITITDTRHIYANEYRSIGGVGGYGYQEETSIVEWSDGTQLIVEDYRAKAIYKGQTYQLRQFSSDHATIVAHWSRAISARLQRDTGTLADRVRGGVQRDQVSELVAAWNAEHAA